MYDTEIIGAKMVTSKRSFNGSILIDDGKIAALSSKPIGNAKRTIDAAGLYALPGMIDQHVHFMDPGETDREDFIHGSSAAASAGVTTVIEHTHGYPIKSLKDFISKREYLSNRSVVDFGLAAHLWPGYFDQIPSLWENGISFFKAFTCTTHGIPGLNNGQLYETFTEIARVGGTILAHCEDDTMTSKNEELLHDFNRTDGHVIQEWRSKEAEDVAVSSVAFIAKLTGAKVTIAHISHPFITDIVGHIRGLGANIWTEICPQYMFLNETMIESRGAFGKFTPPARSKPEANELLRLFSGGSIDILSTDHAPSTKEQKMDGDIWTAHFGLPGIETTFPLMLTAVNRGELSLQRVVEAYSEAPSKRLGLYPQKGSLQIGTDADMTLVDLNEGWTLKEEEIKSKAGWSPYSGMSFKGRPKMTFVRGELVMEEGEIIAKPGFGKYVVSKGRKIKS